MLRSSLMQPVKCLLSALLGASLMLSVYGQNKKISPGSREHMEAAAHKIDQHVAALFKRKQLTVPDGISDEIFLRRTALVVAGRIPTFDESVAFLESSSPDKRKLLINYYMASPGYRSSVTNWLFDLLRVQENFTRRGASAAAYIDFLRESIAYNKPWDKLTSELITAEGSIWEDGAVGYYIRDKGMPLDNLANTMRTFTGTRMECAQCHDHPYEDWERRDYFRLAAFSNKQSEINGQSYRELYRSLNKEDNRKNPKYQLLRQLGDSIYYTSLENPGSGRIKLPSDYQYRDADPGEWVGARTPFGKMIRMSDRRDAEDGKKRFSEWLVSPENPRFASVIVNRMWKRIMGTGLYEPVDEYVEPEKTASPELTRFLIKLMQDLDYDLQKFQHVLLLTRTYTFSTSPDLRDPSVAYDFHGRQLQRMSAEQVWDSLVTLTSEHPDQLPSRTFSKAIYLNGKQLNLEGKNMATLSREILSLDSADKLEKYLDKLIAEAEDSKGKQDRMMNGGSRPGPASGLARASELPTPAPAGHFLREFGQSDRLLVDSSSREPNVGQILDTLNGQVETMVVSNESAALNKRLSSYSSPEDKIRVIFLSILSRTPTALEMDIMKEEVAQTGDKAYPNIISALLLTREFLFVQ
ncbi:Protein of unknown function [Rubritalea squalenifaciens DSM 18772]|uniref:DUF1553 domain-containing protein n=1 Tax=Rubritalea squalenifaciens DSM 18772 TaxID=1123071 RepID=A0A1M6GJR0_9BACT|nr:DUF1549 domain-containing protein [Rubritalea squalenifaciens]SHJ10161.1 Protein of unknown function [Rubritalea squalenifaciens DSM 18772]